jgi:hypothetical protein
MTEPENMLRQNAEEVKQIAEAMQEMKIYNAMHSGVLRGKERVKRRSLFSGVSITLTAAAVVLLIFSFLMTEADNAEYKVRSTATTKAWSDSKQFEALISRDKSLASAVNQNLIQPVFQGVEKAGLEVEIMGTVSDGRQVFILYSVQNNTGQTVIHAGFSLSFGKFEAADIGARLEMAGSDNEIRAGETVYFVYSNYLSTEKDYPKDAKYNVILTQISEIALTSSSNKYRTSLDVPFKLNIGLLNDQNRTWISRQDLTVGGQKLKVKQVLFTPLNTYVDVEVNERNGKQIFGMINPVLIGISGDRIIKSYYPSVISADNSEIYTDRTKITLVYKGGSEYEQLDNLSLKTFGIAALDKNQMKIVVDLDKKKIIEAPDGLSLDNSDKTAGAGELGFWHKVETDYARDSFIMRLSDSYTDAKGKMHSMSAGNGAFSQSLSRGPSVEETYYYNFGEKANKLPQPLTIAIDRYWNPIMDTQSVELFSK